MKRINVMALLSLFLFLVVCSYMMGRAIGSASTKSQAKKLEEELSEKIRVYEGFIQKEEGKLFQRYPKLKVYIPEENQVDDEYLSSFIVNRSWDGDNQYKVNIKMCNNKSYEIKPDFTLYFLNKEGFIIAKCKEDWIINTIKPAETRITNRQVSFRFGEPAYFFVEFSGIR